METQKHGEHLTPHFARRPLPTLALRAPHREHQWPWKIGVPFLFWYIWHHFYYVRVVLGGLVG